MTLTKEFSETENIIIIEWADKVEKILSKDTLWIRFENLGKNKRKVIL